MIAIINYGMGNIGSITNMLHKIGGDAVVTSQKCDVLKADKIILPGVGTFDHGMRQLMELDLISPIQTAVLEKKIPILGICLGMQLLGRRSEEGKGSGLNLIPFDNIHFALTKDSGLKIPHMGWNVVKFRKVSPILKDIEEGQRYYFVHSYHAVCDNPENILMSCEYGYEFPAAISDNNIYGVQFHPEKSHRFGMRLLENFVRRL